MSGPFGSSQWMYSSGGGFYDHTIDDSLRIDYDGNHYVSRTPSSAGNRKTWTWSGWVKRCRLNTGAPQTLFSAGTTNGAGDNSRLCLQFNSSNTLITDMGGIGQYNESNALYRDTSSWYHIVWRFDVTNGTAIDRSILYVNGERISDQNLRTFNQNADHQVNATTVHRIGALTNVITHYGDFYLAEINFVDGQALSPTSFGEYKSGVWIPKKYSGSYGTNGFYLKFANSGSLGTDSSGNSNNWTPSNIVATDQVGDSPTNNFPTINVNELRTNTKQAALAAEGQADACPTFHIPATGKWYAEFVPATIGNNTHFGFTRSDKDARTHSDVDSFRMVIPQGGSLYLDGTGLSSPQSASGYSAGNVLSLAIDMDNGHAYWRANNTIIGSLTNQAVIRDNRWKFLTYMNASNDRFAHNYGQDSSFYGLKTAQGNTDENGQGDFYYTPPSGYLALCSANLLVAEAVDPAEDNTPKDYFKAIDYTGNGGTLSITSVDWKPDFVWLKRTNSANQHNLHDIVRGPTKVLHSNSSEAEETITNGLTSFNSTGFSLGSDGAWNASGQPYVAWNWKGSNTTVSNTTGSITTTVCANPDSGFSVLTYTGTGSNSTLGHGLGKKPSMIICKKRNGGASWRTYHKVLGATKRLYLDETGAEGTSSTVWNNTEPTSSVFTIGTDSAINQSGATFVSYLFSEIEGFSSFGGWRGNGDSDGPFVYTGHLPQFLLIKRLDTTGNWVIFDTIRNRYNLTNLMLFANSAEAQDSTGYVDLLSNGFKWRSTNGTWNASGGRYVYASFASNPFKYANAR
jgi:hypothetical protein